MAAVATLRRSLWSVFTSSQAVRARLARNTFWSIAGSASSQGSSLLAAVVVARLLGTARFGQLALIQATVLLTGTLGEMGLTLTTTKFVSRWRVTDPERAGRLMGWSLRTIATSGLIMAALLAGMQPYIKISGLAGLSKEISAGCGLLLFDMLNRVQLGALGGLEQFGSTARIQLARGLLMLPCVWLGTWRSGLLGAVLAMAFVSLATFVIGHWVLRSKCRSLLIPLRYWGAREPEILTTSMSLWMGALLLAGSSWIVTVLLSREPSGLSELGLYNAADKWKTALLFLPNQLFQVTLPMLSYSQGAGDHRACRRIISAALISALGVTGAGAILVFSLSRVLMSSYGVGFTQGASVLSLAALVAVTSAIYTVGSSALWALGKPTQMLGIDILKTFLHLGLCWIGYASSARNLMLAYLLSSSAGCVVVMFAVWRHLEIQMTTTDAIQVEESS
ncbi:MAG TPA: oligosaccharide flippase family protein [Terriglobales bacterium]|nr:oligosaccharide flippase family protein [Terriglobales bacterium]